MILVHNDLLCELLALQERLSVHPEARIDNKPLRAAFLKQMSESPDNIAAARHIEYGKSGEREFGPKHVIGLKVQGKDVMLSELMWQLECDEVVALLHARLPQLSGKDIQSALRVCTAVLSGLEVLQIEDA